MTAPAHPTAAGVFVVRDPAVCAALEQLLAPHRTDPTLTAPASSQGAVLMADAEARAAELTGDPTDNLAPDATIEQLLNHVHEDGLTRGREAEFKTQSNRREELAAGLRRAETDLSHAEKQLDETTAQLQDALAKIAALEKAAITTAVPDAGELEAERARHAETRARLADVEADLEQTTQERNDAHAAATGRGTALDQARAELTELRAEMNTPRPQASPSRPVPVPAARARDRDAFASLARRMEDQSIGKEKPIADTLRVAAGYLRREIGTVYGPEAKAS